MEQGPGTVCLSAALLRITCGSSTGNRGRLSDFLGNPTVHNSLSSSTSREACELAPGLLS